MAFTIGYNSLQVKLVDATRCMNTYTMIITDEEWEGEKGYACLKIEIPYSLANTAPQR